MSDWPPDAPALTRRCAAIIAAQQARELDHVIRCPTDKVIQAARDVIVAELALAPNDLFAVLADHWPQLCDRRMPDQGGRLLLTFAQDVLLGPLAGASALIWIVVDQPELQTPPVSAAVRSPDAWKVWSGAYVDERWEDLIATELARLGQPRENVPDDGDDADHLLGSVRAARLSKHGDTALVAASIVRTSGWPGNTTIIAPLAHQAVRLALDRPQPPTDDDRDDFVDAIQHDLMPSPETLMGWLSDPSVGTFDDHAGLASTGSEMLERVADWVTWYLSHQAYLLVRASGRTVPTNG